MPFAPLGTGMKKTAAAPCLYIYAHIPKCAGSTLTYHLEQNFPREELMPLYNYKFYNHSAGRFENPESFGAAHAGLRAFSPEIKDKIRFVYGHLAWHGTHTCFSRPARYITFLRHPVARVVSTYYQYRRRHRLDLPRGAWADLPPDLGFEEWLESGHPRISNHMTSFLSRENNDAVHIKKPMDRSHLERAKKNLERFFFVGITEKTPVDFSYLFDLFGIRRFFKARNTTANRTITLSDTITESILSKNRLDRELYDFARTLNMLQRASLAGFWPRVARTWFRRNVLSLREPAQVDFMR